MNIHLNSALRFTTCILLFLTVYFHAEASHNDANFLSKEEIRQRIESLSSQIELKYTDEIHTIIQTLVQKQRIGAELILARGQIYFPLYENQFANEGLPEELKYLSVVESGLRPEAVSRAGAVGLWQFMPATARLYGLSISASVDERRDPIRSTEAASAYLRDLYKEFGDWTLAMAAYNCGPGAVKRAMRNSTESDFWKIRGFLPRETRRYIPKYIAFSYLMNYYMLHDLSPMTDGGIENKLATARIFDHITFNQIASYTGLTMEEVSALNPAYLKGFIPKRSQGYNLTLPEQDLYKLIFEMGLEHNMVYSRRGSALEAAYMQRDMRQRWLEISSEMLLPSLAFDNMAIKELLEKPLPLPTSQFSAHTKSIALNQSRYRRLEKNQSLQDLADKLGINYTTLLELNEVNLNNPPRAGAYIRIE